MHESALPGGFVLWPAPEPAPRAAGDGPHRGALLTVLAAHGAAFWLAWHCPGETRPPEFPVPVLHVNWLPPDKGGGAPERTRAPVGVAPASRAAPAAPTPTRPAMPVPARPASVAPALALPPPVPVPAAPRLAAESQPMAAPVTARAAEPVMPATPMAAPAPAFAVAAATHAGTDAGSAGSGPGSGAGAGESEGEPDTPPSYHADYLANPAPAYPLMSRRLGEEGTVTLRVRVGPDGLPRDILLQSGSGHARLDQAARDAVAAWRFAPARLGSKSVAGWVVVPIHFSLRR